jgi:manganese-dependent inorganic pyrophosphatase
MPTPKDRHDPWAPELLYVVGHQRPDTDAIASALGYAWYLNAIGQENARAARAGQPGEQAQFALKRFEQAAPRLLTGVAPTFGHAAISQPSVSPDAPLPAAMVRVAEGDRVIPLVDSEGKPTGVVTSLALARAYTAPVNVSVMLMQPCRSISENALTFAARDRISDHRSLLLRSENDDFLVVDDGGLYVGVATRRRILEPPRARLILVDHNELSQAVVGADEAEIVAVLDHHRLGNAPTAAPIPFVVEPVGSTSTLVAEKCRSAGLAPPPGLAGMLLSGILSDTLLFRSPTTTDRDEAIARWLVELAGLDLQTYGEELLRAAPGLNARAASEIVDADRKSYQMGGLSVSIGQVEVTGLQELPDRRAELLETMEQRRQSEAHALICLMITDVVAEHSVLLCQGESRILGALPFARVGENEFDLEDMVSRKKQLVPSLHAVLEEPR